MTNFGCHDLGNHGVVVADILESRVQTFVVKYNQNNDWSSIVLLVLLQLLVKDISSSFLRNLNPLWFFDLDSEPLTSLHHGVVNVLSEFILSWSLVDDDPLLEVQILSVLNLKSSQESLFAVDCFVVFQK